MWRFGKFLDLETIPTSISPWPRKPRNKQWYETISANWLFGCPILRGFFCTDIRSMEEIADTVSRRNTNKPTTSVDGRLISSVIYVSVWVKCPFVGNYIRRGFTTTCIFG